MPQKCPRFEKKNVSETNCLLTDGPFCDFRIWICTVEMGLPVPIRGNCVTLINFTWHRDLHPLYEKNDLIIMFFFIVLLGSSLIVQTVKIDYLSSPS